MAEFIPCLSQSLTTVAILINTAFKSQPSASSGGGAGQKSCEGERADELPPSCQKKWHAYAATNVHLKHLE